MTTTPFAVSPSTASPDADRWDETGEAPRSERSRKRTLLRRVVGGLVLLGLLALTAVLPEPRTTRDPLAPDSTAENGSRAAAQLLQREGVQINHVTGLRDALDAAEPGTTLFVTSHSLLYEEHVERLAETGADLVLVDPGYLIGYYTSRIDAEYDWLTSGETVAAECADTDATAAGELSWMGSGYTSTHPDVTLCFEQGEQFGMAVSVADGQRITALATSGPFTNDLLDEGGNAALALRLLGKNEHLVWFTPTSTDLRDLPDGGDVSIGNLVPSWFSFAAIQLLVLVVFIALWRGRRLGPLVAEPLPVVVQSAEATRGRGRLYRRARSHGHAGAALRAASASRCATRLGLPRSAGAEAVIDAVAYASGRSTTEVARLLYGPPPTSDSGLTHLARELDRLESEVNRP